MSINASLISAMQAKPPDLTLGGIPAWVSLENFEAGSGFPDGPWRTVEYHVLWDQSDAFIDLLVPQVSLFGIPGSSPSIVFRLPHAYPGNRNIWCMNARKRPLGANRPDNTGGK